jgi:NAD-dependent dihydropyrimidine dehydrogenase PreA subunit
MSLFKTLWGLLFRLFPCPTRVGLRRLGNPDRHSPVLVTCNFHTTVKRLTRVLKKARTDAWLLVADSKGVNVWCAACGDEFNTRSVISAVKTSGVAYRVDHRRLILPPLGASGIRTDEVRAQTGWSTCWGPVYAGDLPRYLAAGRHRDESMRRVTYRWRERLDTALGSLFLFYLVGALGVLLIARGLLASYLAVGALTFVLFLLTCPWLPGKRGLTKVLLVDLGLAGVLLTAELLAPGASPLRAHLGIAMVMLLIYGSELGGLTSTLPSDLDPFMARLGIGAVGNVAFAGTVRTELLNGFCELNYARELCNGCRRCFDLCPQGVWEMDDDKRAALARREDCTACRACLIQCMTEAIRAERVEAGGAGAPVRPPGSEAPQLPTSA